MPLVVIGLVIAVAGHGEPVVFFERLLQIHMGLKKDHGFLVLGLGCGKVAIVKVAEALNAAMVESPRCCSAVSMFATFFFFTPGLVAMVLANALSSALWNRFVRVIHHSVLGSHLSTAYMESQWACQP